MNDLVSFKKRKEITDILIRYRQKPVHLSRELMGLITGMIVPVNTSKHVLLVAINIFCQEALFLLMH